MLNALEGIGLRYDGSCRPSTAYESHLARVASDTVSSSQVLSARAGATQPSSGMLSLELQARKSVVAPARPGRRQDPASGLGSAAVFPRREAARPELDKPDTLQWMDASSGASMPSAPSPFHERRALRPRRSKAWRVHHAYLLRAHRLPDDLPPPWRGRTGAGRLMRRCPRAG
ncbi:MAG: hypothetical protein M5R42_01480 [Rhodocyclaceae bacterium]|nr:hypothetical protein [Rhodocyclaceae bacterium]